MTAVYQSWKTFFSPHENTDSGFQENVKTSRVYFLQKRIKNWKILAEVWRNYVFFHKKYERWLETIRRKPSIGNAIACISSKLKCDTLLGNVQHVRKSTCLCWWHLSPWKGPGMLMVNCREILLTAWLSSEHYLISSWSCKYLNF